MRISATPRSTCGYPLRLKPECFAIRLNFRSTQKSHPECRVRVWTLLNSCHNWSLADLKTFFILKHVQTEGWTQTFLLKFYYRFFYDSILTLSLSILYGFWTAFGIELHQNSFSIFQFGIMAIPCQYERLLKLKIAKDSVGCPESKSLSGKCVLCTRTM